MNKFFKTILFFYSFPLFLLGLSGQNQFMIDSLRVEIDNAASDNDKANIIIDLSRLYWKVDFSIAKELAYEAIELQDEDKPTTQTAKAYRNLGNTELLSGNYQESLKSLHKAYETAVECKSDFEQFASLVSMGGVYDRLENFDKSLEYYFDAMAIFNNNNNPDEKEELASGAIALYNNIGNYYLTKSEHEKAKEYYTKGLGLANKRNDYYNIGSICNNLGKIYFKTGDNEKALDFLKKSEEARLKSNDLSGLAKTYYVIAEFYTFNKQYEDAILYGLKSYNLGIEVGALLSQHSALMILANSYEKLADYEMAYKYHKEFKQVGDSIFNENTIREITHLQFINEQAKIDNEKLDLEQKRKLKVIFLITLLIIAFLVVSLLLLLSWSRHRRLVLEKDMTEEDIQHKKKELATNVLYLIRNKEAIEDITTKLVEIKKKVPAENKKLIQELIVVIQNQIDTSSWEEFELRFQEVHEGFYKRLQVKYPDLSPSERKLAAFLKLNMSSKEISAITRQSVRSIEVARYRLRRKLDISNTDTNLVVFLSEI